MKVWSAARQRKFKLSGSNSDSLPSIMDAAFHNGQKKDVLGSNYDSNFTHMSFIKYITKILFSEN